MVNLLHAVHDANKKYFQSLPKIHLVYNFIANFHIEKHTRSQ